MENELGRNVQGVFPGDLTEPGKTIHFQHQGQQRRAMVINRLPMEGSKCLLQIHDCDDEKAKVFPLWWIQGKFRIKSVDGDEITLIPLQ